MFSETLSFFVVVNMWEISFFILTLERFCPNYNCLKTAHHLTETAIDSSHIVSKRTTNHNFFKLPMKWGWCEDDFLLFYYYSFGPYIFHRVVIILPERYNFTLPLQVILTANLPFTETPGGVILTSMDAGVTFRSVQLPFHPAQAIQFHYQDPKYLVGISIDVSKVFPPVSSSPLNRF